MRSNADERGRWPAGSLPALAGIALMAVIVGTGTVSHVLERSLSPAQSAAQEIADAAALAGGSAFLEDDAKDAAELAEQRAYQYALRQEIRGAALGPAQVTVEVNELEREVRVGINPKGFGAHLQSLVGLHVSSPGVTAVASAQPIPNPCEQEGAQASPCSQAFTLRLIE